MASSNKLLVGLLAAGAVIFIATLTLPDSMAPSWIRFAQPAFLLVSAGLALINARSYRADLRLVFGLLAGFLLLYGLLNVEPLNDQAFEQLGDDYFRSLFIYQIVDYGLLLSACVFIVRGVAVGRMSIYTWTATVLAFVLGAAIVWNAMPTYELLGPINRDAANIYLFIRVFDALVAVALVPVIALYVENARANQKESASFTIVLVGVVNALVFVYLYEFVSGDSLLDIAVEQTMTGSLLDAIYVFGYWVIGTGLVVHWMHHRLTFADLDRMLEQPA